MAITEAAEPLRGFSLSTFVCETHADLLPHFVRWYQRLGLDRFLLVMHGSWSPESLATIASLPGVECVRQVEGSFCTVLSCAELTAIALRHVGEWTVVVDADEFLEMPVPTLREMVAVLEAAGVDERYASLLQRMAADGSLPEMGADSDRDALFPMMQPGLTEHMGMHPPTWKSKYPFARIGPDFVYQRCNHLQGNSRSLAHVPVRAVLHHFKWRSRLFDAFTRERGEGEKAGEMAVYGHYLAEERAAGGRGNLRVDFVTFELGGPGAPNGGIATAMSTLAKLQAAYGVQVEVFY